jgi:processive 1,2-diacylglycerol beta-glucosyltransferase
MTDANLLITKPGAVTCTEALAMELPILLYAPIPGQEEDNADYLVREGAAMRSSDEDDLAAIVDTLLLRSELLLEMQCQARRLGRPDAASTIVNIILRQLSYRHTVSSTS